MHFIAVHIRSEQFQNKEVIYLNPEHISVIRNSENGAEVTLSNGKTIGTWENADDLIVKVRGFVKPKSPVAEPAERHVLSDAS